MIEEHLVARKISYGLLPLLQQLTCEDYAS